MSEPFTKGMFLLENFSRDLGVYKQVHAGHDPSLASRPQTVLIFELESSIWSCETSP